MSEYFEDQYDQTLEMKNEFDKDCTSRQETIWNRYDEYIIVPDQASSGEAVWGQNSLGSRHR